MFHELKASSIDLVEDYFYTSSSKRRDFKVECAVFSASSPLELWIFYLMLQSRYFKVECDVFSASSPLEIWIFYLMLHAVVES